MKWDCGPDYAERARLWDVERARLEEWHRHFCLWPTEIASHDCRWLEYVERKGKAKYDPWEGDYYFTWEYRVPQLHSQGD